uniref:Clathrin assembly protein n=1 Tax=Rhabditophanes sp. KR3021 TaxID=114890 RepID=A0AC35TT96_9BILA
MLMASSLAAIPFNLGFGLRSKLFQEAPSGVVKDNEAQDVIVDDGPTNDTDTSSSPAPSDLNTTDLSDLFATNDTDSSGPLVPSEPLSKSSPQDQPDPKTNDQMSVPGMDNSGAFNPPMDNNGGMLPQTDPLDQQSLEQFAVEPYYPDYDQLDPAFDQIDPGFGQIDPGFGQINPGFSQIDPGFGQIDPGFGIPAFATDPINNQYPGPMMPY